MQLRTSQVRVYIYPFESPRLDVSPFVVRAQGGRGLTANGSFAVSLVPVRDWANVIATGSWVRIDVQRGRDMQMEIATWGRIDAIQRSIQATGGGERRRVHTLVGRDHSGVLLDCHVYFNPFLAARSKEIGVDIPAIPLLSDDVVDGLELALTESFGGNPAAYVEFLYEAFLGRGVSSAQLFELPESMRVDLAALGVSKAVKARDIMELVVGPEAESLNSPGIKGIFFDQTILATQSGGRFWDLLKRYSNPSFNELFCTINQTTGLPEVQFREQPFPAYTRNDSGDVVIATRAWESLTGVIIPRRAFSIFNVGRSEEARINYWMLFADGTPLLHQDQVFLMGEGFLQGAPIVDLVSIQRYGLRRFEASTLYIGYDAPQTGERWVIPASYWLTQLYSWYVLNHRYLNGTAQVPYLERGEPGQRIWVKNVDGTFTEFYLEHISWMWTKDDRGATRTSTTFQLSRGVGGIQGEAVYGQSDLVRWDVAGDYPLPDPPSDVRTLLDVASNARESWTDPDELASEIWNEDLDSAYTIQQGLEDYREYDVDFLGSAASIPPVTNGQEPATRLAQSPENLHASALAYFEEGGAPGGVEGGDSLVVYDHNGDVISDAGEDQGVLLYRNTNIAGPVPNTTRELDPAFIVLHSTNGHANERFFINRDTIDAPGTAFNAAVANRFANRWVEAAFKRGIATHFVISQEGTIIQLLPIDRRGVHAKRGNDGIGLDIEGGPGGFSNASLEALSRLVRSNELRTLPIVAHRHIQSGRTDPDEIDGVLTGQIDWNQPPFNRRNAPGVSQLPRAPEQALSTEVLSGWRDEVDDMRADLEAAGALDNTGSLSSMVTDRTSSFVGANALDALYETEIAGLRQGERYQELLTANGITFGTVEQLTYLRDADAVRRLDDDDVPGYAFRAYDDRAEDDRTLFAIPPESYWRNIMPAMLILQSVFAEAGLDRSDWVIADAYRPADYNREVGGSDQDVFRFNHAVAVALTADARATSEDGETVEAGESFWALLRSSEALLARYGAVVILYEEDRDDDGVRYYLTHIDAGFYADTAPDGVAVDTSTTHRGRSAGRFSILAL